MTGYLRTHTTCPWCRMRFEIGEPQTGVAKVGRCGQCGTKHWTAKRANPGAIRVGIAPKDLRVKGMTK